jgi:hypothetical protein
MSINCSTEELLTLTEAAKAIPRRRGNRPVHVSCIYRWTQSGCKGIRLESIQIGGTRCTSREALARFFAALSQQAGLTADSGTATRSTARRQKDSERAAKELEQLGI